MTLAKQLAAGRVSVLPRLTLEPIGRIGGGCHAGAGHAPGFDCGSYGVLCSPCREAVARLLRGPR